MDEHVTKTLNDLNLTNEEVKKFDKAFKDPEFIKLFDDYLSEISTPEAREEQMAYLRQLEKDGKGESIYGKGVKLLAPAPGFVVKTRDKRTGGKVFINICTSDQIEVATSKRAVNSLGHRGLNWDIPSTIGKSKSGTDKKGQQCRNVDYVVHPMTLQMAEKNAGFKHMIVETAIEKFEETEALKLDRNFSCPRMKYHGIDGASKPSVLAIRTAEGGSVEKGFLQPQANNKLDEKLTATQKENMIKSRNSRSEFAFKEAMPKKPTPKNPKNPGFRHPSGEETPYFKLMESGCVDLADAWEDVGKGLKKRLSYPESLSLRISLPGINSISEAVLNVTELGVSLVVAGKYRLELCLPYPVDFAKGKAKFIKSSKILSVRLPVVPPAPQQSVHPPGSSEPKVETVPASMAEPPPAAEVMQQGIDFQDGDTASPSIGTSCDGQQNFVQNQAARVQCEGFHCPDATVSGAEKAPREGKQSRDPGAEAPPANHVHRELTENQRKWMELHRQEDSRCAEFQPGSKTPDDAEARKGIAPEKSDREAISSGQFVESSAAGSSTEQSKGAMSGAVASGSSAAGGKENKKTTKSNAGGARIRPRISRTVADELD